MNPITHISQKILAERARRTSRPRSPLEAAPPPYTSSESDTDSEGEDEDDDRISPMKLTINAAHSIQGCNNLVPTSASPLADATKFSTLLLHAVNQMNNAVNTQGLRSRRSVKLDLTINCGTTVVGDRNVIGNVGMRPRVPQSTIPRAAVEFGSSTVAGAKRKAEEDSEDEHEPKKIPTTEASRA